MYFFLSNKVEMFLFNPVLLLALCFSVTSGVFKFKLKLVQAKRVTASYLKVPALVTGVACFILMYT